MGGHKVRNSVAILFFTILVFGNICFSDIKKLPNKSEHIGFKELHLGITKEDVNRLVKESAWCYQFGLTTEKEPYYDRNMPQYKDENFLWGDDGKEGENLRRIGCEGSNGEEECYYITSILVKFFKDKIIKITLDSPSYTADKIDSHLKDWGRFALNGLTKKYGKPIVNQSIEKVTIFSFKSGFNVPLYEWNVNSEKISLSIGEYESEFDFTIIFEDVKAKREIQNIKAKSKSEF